MRDREEKETEEVEVGGEAVEGGGNEAIGGGGDGPAAGGGGGSAGIGGLGSSTYTDQEVLEMPPDRRNEAVERGALSVRQMQSLLGGSSKTIKELLQSLLLTTATAEASAAEAVAAVDAKVAAEAALAVAAAAAGDGRCGGGESRGVGGGGGGDQRGWRGPRVSGDVRAGNRVRGGGGFPSERKILMARSCSWMPAAVAVALVAIAAGCGGGTPARVHPPNIDHSEAGKAAIRAYVD